MLRKNCLIWENLYDISEADIILLGVPFDSTSTGFPGSRFAPNKIRDEFNHVYGYDPAMGDLGDLKLFDAGNVECVPGDVASTHARVQEEVAALKETNPKAKFVVLGGEHSISLPVVKALQPQNYVCFDAHYDLLDDYDGVKLSHTAVNRRVHELGVSVEVRGARTGEKEEYEYAKKLGKVSGPCYVSVDVDVLQGIPTGCPVPEGWTLTQLWGELKGLDIVACDVVEYNPMRGEDFAVAELVKRLLLKVSR